MPACLSIVLVLLVSSVCVALAPADEPKPGATTRIAVELDFAVRAVELHCNALRVSLALQVADSALDKETLDRIETTISGFETRARALSAQTAETGGGKELLDRARRMPEECDAAITKALAPRQQEELQGRRFLAEGEMMHLQEDPAGFFKEFTRSVQLTPAQKTKIIPLLEERTRKIKALNDEFDDEPRPHARPLEAVLAEEESLVRDTLVDLNRLLTPEQTAQLAGMILPLDAPATQPHAPKEVPVAPEGERRL